MRGDAAAIGLVLVAIVLAVLHALGWHWPLLRFEAWLNEDVKRCVDAVDAEERRRQPWA